jgi:lysozyme
MTTSPQGRALIEGFESLRTTAYQDQGGIWTIGYGHTANVKMGDTCTPAQADAWLTDDLRTAEKAVNDAISKTVSLTQNQFDACVSLAENIGGGAFSRSTLVSLLNRGDMTGCANQFLAWDKINDVSNQGLLNRRRAERALFLGH